MEMIGISGPVMAALRPWLGTIPINSAVKSLLSGGGWSAGSLAGLGAALGIPAGGEDSRISQYYVPTFLYIESMIQRRRQASSCSNVRPLVVGISAPQGCGKTTLTMAMEYMLRDIGRSCVSLSIDDFYLTGAELESLASHNPDNFILQSRGNAGTHDLELFHHTINSLLSFGDAVSSGAALDLVVRVPRFDKSLRGGKGDRAPEDKWTVVTDRPDVILLEGWMLGFEAVTEDRLADIEAFRRWPELKQINSNLKSYSGMHRSVDAWIVVAVSDAAVVHRWRLEAERNMRAQGKPGMSDEEVAAFVDRYMPAYSAYLPTLYSAGPERSAPSLPVLKISVDQDRSPVAAELNVG